MKKIIALLTVLSMLLTCALSVPVYAGSSDQNVSIWDGTVYDLGAMDGGAVFFTFDGEGTETSPYLLKSADDVSKLAANVRYAGSSENYKGKYFKLTCDIDLRGHKWKGIGGGGSTDVNARFEGTFDGDGHVIYNLNLYDEGQSGFFGFVGNGAVIKNLGIASGNSVFTNRDRVGALIGAANLDVTVINCFNRSNITNNLTTHDGDGSHKYMGGLIGSIMNKANESTHILQDCYNSGNVTVNVSCDGFFTVGGLLGYLAEGTNTIARCYNTGNVTVNATAKTTLKTSNRAFDNAIGSMIGAYAWTDSLKTTVTDCGVGGSVVYTNSATDNQTAYIGAFIGSICNSAQWIWTGETKVALSEDIPVINYNGSPDNPIGTARVDLVEVPIQDGYEFFSVAIREESDTPYDDTIPEGGNDTGNDEIGNVPTLEPQPAQDYVPKDDADRARYEAASKWDGTVYHVSSDSDIYTFEGTGSKKDPYLLKSAEDVAKLAANVRYNNATTCYPGKYFKLTCDINMQHHEWWGIGGMCSDTNMSKNQNSMFMGIFLGDHHVIYNFNLADSDTEGAPLHFNGFFGFAGYSAEIENLGIMNGDVYIENSNRVGALIGCSQYDLYVTNCFNQANISVYYGANADVHVGGLIGGILNQSSNVKYITDCYNTGDITVNVETTASHAVGGIVGYVYECEEFSLTNCYSIGDITVNANHGVVESADYYKIGVGGLIGGMGYKGTYTIENCGVGGSVTYNNTTASATSILGAIVGCLKVEHNVNLKFEEMVQYSVNIDPDKAVGYGASELTAEKVTSVIVPTAEGSMFIALPKVVEPNTPSGPQNPGNTDPDDTTNGTEESDVTSEEETRLSTQTPPASNESGCSSVLTVSSLGLIAILALAGVTVCKKK